MFQQFSFNYSHLFNLIDYIISMFDLFNFHVSSPK